MKVYQKTGLFFLLFFWQTTAHAQNPHSHVIRGYVTIDSVYTEGVHVLNLTNNLATVSNFYGFYNIDAKPGDILVLSSVAMGVHKVTLKKVDFEFEVFHLNFLPAVNLLSEVELIEYASINAKSLGIIPTNFKSYTPAEKELDAATNWNVVGSSFSFDPILNWLSGRTKKLKRNLRNEKQYKDFLLVHAMYRESYFTDELKIPEKYVGGFVYYLADHLQFVTALKQHDEPMKIFWILELANRYKREQGF